MSRYGWILALACNLALPGYASAQASAVDTPAAVRILLIPRAEATLASQMAGHLRSLPKEAGARFRRGDVLARFDCSELEQKLLKARAELDSSQATHRSNLKLQELDSASELEVAISEAEVRKARADVGIVTARTAYCVVQAPYAGQVIKRHVNPRENVGTGQELLDIIADGTPKVQLFAPSRWSAWLRPGQRFEVQIDETGKRYPVMLTRLVGQVDPVSQTVEVRAEFPDQHPELLPGMTGNALLEPPGNE